MNRFGDSKFELSNGVHRVCITLSDPAVWCAWSLCNLLGVEYLSRVLKSTKSSELICVEYLLLRLASSNGWHCGPLDMQTCSSLLVLVFISLILVLIEWNDFFITFNSSSSSRILLFFLLTFEWKPPTTSLNFSSIFLILCFNSIFSFSWAFKYVILWISWDRFPVISSICEVSEIILDILALAMALSLIFAWRHSISCWWKLFTFSNSVKWRFCICSISQSACFLQSAISAWNFSYFWFVNK